VTLLEIGKKYLVRRRYYVANSFYRDMPMQWDEGSYRGLVDSMHQFQCKVRGFDHKALVAEQDIAKRVKEIPAPDVRGKVIRNHQRSLRNQRKLPKTTRMELEAQSGWSWRYEIYTGPEKEVFLADLRKFCRPLMLKHGLTDWKIVIDDEKRQGGAPRLGYCCKEQKEIGFKFAHAGQIYYNADKVEQTLLHEIAHALDPLPHPKQSGRGTENGSWLKCIHAESWVRKAYEIGCRDFHGADADVIQRVLTSVNAPPGTYGTGSISIVEGKREAV
jgi:hypothetical protein